ncbi:MAG: hypothetical protein ACFFE6_13575, partial [Candidatus Thorarchaeota archaeon]
LIRRNLIVGICVLTQYSSVARRIIGAFKMQPSDIVTLLMDILLSPIFAFVIVVIVVIGAVRFRTRSRTGSSMPVVKQMRRMILDVEKEREITTPNVKSRQELITSMFGSQMNAIGLDPVTDSGYIPVSQTPLARYLKERGVQNDTVDAIVTGLMEEENEEHVRAIVDAAADTPGVDLTGEELEKAKQLAVDEWKNVRRIKGA